MNKWAVFVCFQTARCKPTGFPVPTLQAARVLSQLVLCVAHYTYFASLHKFRSPCGTSNALFKTAQCAVLALRDEFAHYTAQTVTENGVDLAPFEKFVHRVEHFAYRLLALLWRSDLRNKFACLQRQICDENKKRFVF